MFTCDRSMKGGLLSDYFVGDARLRSVRGIAYYTRYVPKVLPSWSRFFPQSKHVQIIHCWRVMTFSCRSVIPGCSHDPWLWKAYDNWITSDAQMDNDPLTCEDIENFTLLVEPTVYSIAKELGSCFQNYPLRRCNRGDISLPTTLSKLLLCSCPVPTIFAKELSTFVWETDVVSLAYRFSKIRSCMEPWDKNSRSQNINPLLSLAIRWRVASQHLVKMTRLSQKSWGCLCWSFLDDLLILLGFRDTLVLFCHWVVGVPCCVYRYRGYEARWDCMLNSCKSDLTRNEIP